MRCSGSARSPEWWKLRLTLHALAERSDQPGRLTRLCHSGRWRVVVEKSPQRGYDRRGFDFRGCWAADFDLNWLLRHQPEPSATALLAKSELAWLDGPREGSGSAVPRRAGWVIERHHRG